MKQNLHSVDSRQGNCASVYMRRAVNTINVLLILVNMFTMLNIL
jgi:hypothetical protein